jgi:tripartite-type tricarboxylate transporter receptor subunit TctC
MTARYRDPLLMTLVAAFFFLLAGGDAGTQANRTIKIVVAVPPGGNTDIVARVLADQIGRAHGPTMVIENRPGAGSAIATEAVARAAPDGNTLLLAGNSFVVNPHLRKVNYDPLASFEPICYLVTSPTVIVVNAASPYRTLADLIAAARAKPGELTLASVGPGSAAHIAIEVLKRVADVNLTFVPYPGTAPAINALLGQHVTSVLANVTDVVEQVKAGQLRRAGRRLADADRAAARRADRRRVRLQGLRGGHLVRRAGTGPYAEGNRLPARRLVHRRDAGPRHQAQAPRPGALSRGIVRRRFRRAYPQTV